MPPATLACPNSNSSLIETDIIARVYKRMYLLHSNSTRTRTMYILCIHQQVAVTILISSRVEEEIADRARCVTVAFSITKLKCVSMTANANLLCFCVREMLLYSRLLCEQSLQCLQTLPSL